MIKVTAILFTATLSLTSQAAVYKCEQNGVVVFQQTPCSLQESGLITVKPLQASGVEGIRDSEKEVSKSMNELLDDIKEKRKEEQIARKKESDRQEALAVERRKAAAAEAAAAAMLAPRIITIRRW